ncbi:MAG: hypothetical protein LBE16_09230 [Clostridiales Family XIII bacterium]|jgi:uncharacterized protein with PIN domain|nr:hypothetical protein [Clostridiales Family XIII bacterium]
MAEKSIPICNPCKVKLKTFRTDFTYMGRSFSTETLRCPECGQIYLPEELVRGRMAEVEYALEDK